MATENGYFNANVLRNGKKSIEKQLMLCLWHKIMWETRKKTCFSVNKCYKILKFWKISWEKATIVAQVKLRDSKNSRKCDINYKNAKYMECYNERTSKDIVITKLQWSLNVKILMSDTNHGNFTNNHYLWQFVTNSWQIKWRVLLVIYKVVLVVCEKVRVQI